MQLHLQRPLPSQPQNDCFSYCAESRPTAPGGVRRWALIPRSGKKMQRASSGYGFDMQYLHTHNRTHTPTRTHTHTQYIISTLNYVLFLCMVQEGGI